MKTAKKTVSHDAIPITVAAQQAAVPLVAALTLAHEQQLFAMRRGTHIYVSRSAVDFLRQMKQEHPELIERAGRRYEEFRENVVDGVQVTRARYIQ